MFQYATELKSEHMDHYGHMNNAAYMQIFEEARWALLESVGFTKESVGARGYGPVLVEAHLLYKRELGVGAKVTVETELLAGERRLFKILQRLKNGDGVVCAEADLKLGLFRLAARKLIAPPQDWLDGLRRLAQKKS